ncbi:hypothetical protein M9H77_12243 [Catharanthus roseus]|uniref:Uncharacterized protein n=1 Tax=Catharanthus roseus TaxID=4058 RepID=A0ACC0BGV7_CATRO|nr:hypothetical protein M9H77_12243 [Catharanthus roseus]
MKKIQNGTKCQVTYSKQRTSLIRKAKEISYSCNVDVTFLAFSLSGRMSQFSNQKMEDLLDRFISLYGMCNHIKNLQNLKLQIEKTEFMYIFFSPILASLHQLSYFSLILLLNIYQKEKLSIENQGEIKFVGSSSSNERLQMHFRSWRNNSYIYPEDIFHEMHGKGKGKHVADAYESSTTKHNNISSASNLTSYTNMLQFWIPNIQMYSFFNYTFMQQQAESNFSFRNLTGEISNNNITKNYLIDAHNYWENQPIGLNHMNIYADEEKNENNNGNDEDVFNEIIISPKFSAKAPPGDFNSFLP